MLVLKCFLLQYVVPPFMLLRWDDVYNVSSWPVCTHTTVVLLYVLFIVSKGGVFIWTHNSRGVAIAVLDNNPTS